MQLDTIIKENVFKETLATIQMPGKPCVINTINTHSYCVAKTDPVFAKALKEANVLLPDGFGIVLACRILFGSKIQKIAGADIHDYLLRLAEKESKSVFYLGASESTLKLIEKRVSAEFPSVRVGSFSPPFKSEFSEEDSAEMIDRINKFNADYVFVGMTAPKQEKWVYDHSSRINTQIITQIGAVFDFYAGTVKRPGAFWINLGLEWFIRLLRSPKRLMRRNLVSTPKFLFELMSLKLFKRGVL